MLDHPFREPPVLPEVDLDVTELLLSDATSHQFLLVLTLQSAPVEASSEAEDSAGAAAGGEGAPDPQRSAQDPDPAGSEGGSTEEKDEPQQVSDPRLNPNYVAVQDPPPTHTHQNMESKNCCVALWFSLNSVQV